MLRGIINEEKPATYPAHEVPWQTGGQRQTQEPSPSKNILNIFFAFLIIISESDYHF